MCILQLLLYVKPSASGDQELVAQLISYSKKLVNILEHLAAEEPDIFAGVGRD